MEPLTPVELAVEATKKAFQRVERQMSHQEYIEACEELASEFAVRAEAAKSEDL